MGVNVKFDAVEISERITKLKKLQRQAEEVGISIGDSVIEELRSSEDDFHGIPRTICLNVMEAGHPMTTVAPWAQRFSPHDCASGIIVAIKDLPKGTTHVRVTVSC